MTLSTSMPSEALSASQVYHVVKCPVFATDTLFFKIFLWSKVLILELPVEETVMYFISVMTPGHLEVTFGNEHTSNRTNGKRKRRPTQHRRIHSPTRAGPATGIDLSIPRHSSINHQQHQQTYRSQEPDVPRQLRITMITRLVSSLCTKAQNTLLAFCQPQ